MLAVLEGASATLARHAPNLLIECNGEHRPDGVKRLGAWLHAHGYTVVFVDDRKLLRIEEYNREVHWMGKGTENFIAIHQSRPDVLERLSERIGFR